MRSHAVTTWRLALLGALLMAASLSPVSAATGDISTYAGLGSSTADGVLATQALLKEADGLASDAAGNLYIAERGRNRVRRVDAVTRVITTVAGTGVEGWAGVGFSGDGGPAALAQLAFPRGVAVDSAGDIFIADTGNNRIRKIDVSTGIIGTVAGRSGSPNCVVPYPYTVCAVNDGGPATQAFLSGPKDVVVDGSGNLYIADSLHHRVRKVDSSGRITTIAGSGLPTYGTGFFGDGLPAVLASLSTPSAVAFDQAGNVYIADTDHNAIRRVNPSGIISTVAGRYGCYNVGYPPPPSDEGGPAVAAYLCEPNDVVLDEAGRIYVPYKVHATYATGVGRVRRFTVGGTIHTVVGTTGLDPCPSPQAGDGGPARDAYLCGPLDVALDPIGNLYVSDLGVVVRSVEGPIP